MNDTKFTPGPWHTWYEKMEISIYDQNSDLICGPIKQCPEQEANAHLIAAAPELYEALNDLLNDCINFDGGKLTDIFMVKASRALTKARGEV